MKVENAAKFTFHFMFDPLCNKEIIVFETHEDFEFDNDEIEDEWSILGLIIENNKIPIYSLDECSYEYTEEDIEGFVKTSKEKITKQLEEIGFKKRNKNSER